MSPTVLVADDSRTIRKVVEMALKAAPFEVVGVGSAKEAMEAAERSPSVILLDYYMPDGSGLEVCRALKNNGSTANIPVIMLGGGHRDFSEEQARGAGASDVVMKPFKTDTLLDAIDAVADASAQAAPGAVGGAQAPAATPAPPEQAEARPAPPSAGGSGAQQAPADSRPRIPVDQDSNPRHPAPRQEGSQPRFRQPTNEPSQPRMRTDGGSKPRIPDSGSQPRIPDSGSQPGVAGSQPRISTPDVNASTRAQEVSSTGAGSAPTAGATGDSGVSNIGMSRAEIETMVKDEVKRSVKEQLPGLLRNIMGEVFQKKVLPKLLQHGEQRVDAIVNERLDDSIREAVRVEIERLLAEE
jgi:CheY-like chemotaxis protein